MSNFKQIAKNLNLHQSGLWVADEFSNVSYPSDGNELCAEIEDSSFWFKHRNKAILSVMKNFPPAGTIFDIGGGNGYVAKGLMEAGFDCVLVEPGKAGAQRALERGVRNVICATLESAEFQPNFLPSVGLFDVIEHIEDDISFLSQIKELLTSNGRLYATVPAYNFLWSGEDIYAGHFRRYTLESISEVMKKAGFQIEYATYFFSFLPPAILLFRSLPYRIGLKRELSSKASKSEHENKENLVGNIVNKVLEREIARIQKKKRLPFGGSCLIVARG